MYSLVPNAVPVYWYLSFHPSSHLRWTWASGPEVNRFRDLQPSVFHLHYSSFFSTTSLLMPHNTMSSAYNMHQGDGSFIPRANTSIINGEKVWAQPLREDPWCSPTPTGIMSVIPTLLFTRVLAPSYISCTYYHYIFLMHSLLPRASPDFLTRHSIVYMPFLGL